MSSKGRRRFGAEKKAQIVRRHLADKVAVSDLADEFGVQPSREEMEVLFTLLSKRYERGSVLVSSNLPFSKWEQIFKDPMMAAAAIDRLIHHSVIIELNVPSFRLEEAKKKQPKSTVRIDSSFLLPKTSRCLIEMLPK